MCGRFVSASPPEDLARYFGAVLDDDRLESSFNVAPTNEVYAVRADDGRRKVTPMRWGLIPSWAKDIKVGSRMINARSESAAERPAFRSAFKRSRCLIPADGFYEWAEVPDQKAKQPYFIHGRDGDPLVFAGLWERWRPRLEDGKSLDPDAEPIESCTILTCRPNDVMAEIHDRMPVLLAPSAWDSWIDPTASSDALASLMRPAPDELLTLVPVSTAVNRVANKGEELIRPIPSEAVPSGMPGSSSSD